MAQLDQEMLERLSGSRPGTCFQASRFGRIFPGGLDLTLADLAMTWRLAQEAGLDCTFAACCVAEDLAGLELLGDFRDFCLKQISNMLPDTPPNVLRDDARMNIAEYKAAYRYALYVGATPSGHLAYSAAVAARKAARALRGRGHAKLVYAAQEVWWQERHRRLLAGEAIT